MKKHQILISEQEKVLNEKIMELTRQINEEHPELLTNISEMPEANPDEDDPEINRKRLQEYYDSLIQMLKKYKPYHTLQEVGNKKID